MFVKKIFVVNVIKLQLFFFWQTVVSAQLIYTPNVVKTQTKIAVKSNLFAKLLNNAVSSNVKEKRQTDCCCTSRKKKKHPVLKIVKNACRFAFEY